MSLWQTLGAALIFAGAVLSQMGPSRH